MPAPLPARPLARSLVPLPDESMPGFVLRLAHRLELPPARIAALTGLPALGGSYSGWPIARGMLTLEPAAAARFAAAARLSPEEAAGLLMDRYAGRYPPLDLASRNSAPNVMSISRRGWVLMDSTRYCPLCLAGDGSLIQQLHGGTWQQQWRLQVVFACPVHQLLLEDRCHQCGTPACLSRLNGSIALVPQASDKHLHPARCRVQPAARDRRPGSAACGAYFSDPAASTATQPLAGELLRLQDQILDRLRPASVTPGADAREYFQRLSLVHNLIMMSWPRARYLTGPEPLATAAGAHVASARQAVEQAKARARPFTELNPPLRKLPVASGATAGLLLAADRLLGWDDPAGLPGRLLPLTETAAALYPQGWYWLRTHPAWPPAVRRAFLPHRNGFAIPARPSGITPVSPRRCRFQSEHIPAKLPPAWCEQHLAHLTGISARHLHRAAALKLVELTSGQAWSRAAELLRLPRRTAELAIFRTRQWIRSGDLNQQAFDQAAEALARELDAMPSHVNYLIRRSALHDRTMPGDHWRAFIHELETQTTHGRGRRHAITPARRQVISVLIWTRITRGEHLFAPAVLADKAAHAAIPRTARLAANAGDVIHNPGGYLTLQAITAAYADELAGHIDQTGTTSNFTWNPPTPLTTQPAPRNPPHATPGAAAPGTEPGWHHWTAVT